jgi:integrase/recombinase XerD
MASGRRRAGLRDLRLADVDLERAELRVEREKGVAGRVLPIARWAASITATYIRDARPILARGRDLPWLFPGERVERMGHNEAREIVAELHTATCAANPDLANLPGKRITTHSLRVTCARLLFANGCPIRSVNAILLHQKLSTTAAYTPIPVAELRRVLLGAHPRA